MKPNWKFNEMKCHWRSFEVIWGQIFGQICNFQMLSNSKPFQHPIWSWMNSRDISLHWTFLLLQDKPNICYVRSKNSLFNFGPITGKITGYYVTGWWWNKTDSGNRIFGSYLLNKTIFNRSERYNKRKFYNFNFCQKSENFQNAITFFPQISST